MPLRARLVDRLLWVLCILSTLSGVALLIVFLRAGLLQQEFLDLNFDAVHSTRTLLRAEVLLTKAQGDLRMAEREPEQLTRASEKLEAALAYERNGQYRRTQREADFVAGTEALLRDLQSASTATPSAEEVSHYARRLRQISQLLSDAEGDRWGGLFTLNAQVRQRMDANLYAGFAAAFLLLVLSGVLAWGTRRKRQLDEAILNDKQRLENEVIHRRDTEQALRHSEAALFAEKEKAQIRLASIGEAVITTDSAGRIDFLNPEAELLCGWTQLEAMGRDIADVAPLLDEHSQAALDPWKNDFSGHRALLRHRHAELIPVDFSASRMLGNQQGETGQIVVLRDAREARILERQLSWQASHDGLTGLCNRREFEKRLGALLTSADPQRRHAMLYLDLDQFKLVNDTCGHTAGDELLRQLGPQLGTPLREHDTLARLGGDEFGVLLVNCGEDDMLAIASRLRESIESFTFDWQGKPHHIGVSIGLIPFSAGEFTVQEIMSRTDSACYMAKDLGRNRIQIYREDDNALAKRHDEMEWVSRIRNALRENRFTLFRQTIVPLGNKQRRHEEVLLRLFDDAGQLVPPGAFIPAAERYGLMQEIDRWVIAEALRRIAMEAPSPQAPIVAINLSGASLASEDLATYIFECLERTGVKARRICFEITETTAISQLDKAIRLIESLKLIGCRFALDDFGSGMSSFNYLRRLPVDYLKIDGSFILGLHQDTVNQAMVRSINEVGHIMGLKTIAEFVENQADLDTLRSLGVDFAQGYHLGRPAPWASPAEETAPASVAAH